MSGPPKEHSVEFALFLLEFSKNETIRQVIDATHGTSLAGDRMKNRLVDISPYKRDPDIDKFIEIAMGVWEGLGAEERAKYSAPADTILGKVSKIAANLGEAGFDLEGFARESQELREFAEHPNNVCAVGDSPQTHMRTIGGYHVARLVQNVPAGFHGHPGLPDGDHQIRVVVITHESGFLPSPTPSWTIAHHLGLRGAKPDEDGFVRDAPEDWIFDADSKKATVGIVQVIAPTQ